MSFIPALITGGASIVSSLLGGSAASNAAKAQQNAAIQAGVGVGTAAQQAEGIVQTTLNQNNPNVTSAAGTANAGIGANLAQILAGYSPYTSTGLTSLGTLQNLATNGPIIGSTFQAPTAASLTDPNNPASAGYQFTLQQGQEALQKAAAAQGSLNSSGTLKSLAGYTTGLANQYYGQTYNQALSSFQANQQSALSQAGILQQLAGQGLTATQGGANALQTAGLAQGQNTLGAATFNAGQNLSGQEYIGNVDTNAALASGNFLTQAANAQAQGTLGQTAGYQGALGALGYYGGQIANGQINGTGTLGSLNSGTYVTPTPTFAPGGGYNLYGTPGTGSGYNLTLPAVG